MNLMVINDVLEYNDVMVRIGSTWYMLDEIGPLDYDSFPISVSNDDGKSFEFDLADVDEFDPIFESMDPEIVGISWKKMKKKLDLYRYLSLY